jgi:hypothetical protein
MKTDIYIHIHTCMIISCSVLLRMKHFSDRSCRENQNTQFILGNFFSENCAVCEIMLENIVEQDSTQIIRRVHISCCLTKATNTHSDCVILIVLHGNNCCTRKHLSVTLYLHCLSCVYSLWVDIGILAVGLDGVGVT